MVEEPDEKTREIKINYEDFQHCQNLMVELQCYDGDSGIYKSVMNSTSRVFSIEEYEEHSCRARYLHASLLVITLLVQVTLALKARARLVHDAEVVSI